MAGVEAERLIVILELEQIGAGWGIPGEKVSHETKENFLTMRAA